MNKITNQSSHLFQSFVTICFLFFSQQVLAAGDFPAPIAATMIITMLAPAACFFYILGCFRSVIANILCVLGLLLPTAIIIQHYQTTNISKYTLITDYIFNLLIISCLSGIFFYLGRFLIKKVSSFKKHIQKMIIYNIWLISLFFTLLISLGYFSAEYSWLALLLYVAAITLPLIYIFKRTRS